MGPMDFVSVIAVNLLWPIGSELAVLGAAKPVPPNELQTNASENGHAMAVVVLSVLALESAASRAGFVLADRPLTGPLLESALGYLKGKLDAHSCAEYDCPVKGFNTDALFDVFIVRDAIVHNHLWSGAFSYDANFNWTAQRAPTPEAGFGDEKFKAHVDMGRGVTTHLALNVVPTRVWSRDAYLVLQTLFRALAALDHVGKPLGIQGHPVVFNRRVITYEAFVRYVDEKAAELR